jgi:hypothetical protein
MMTGAAECGAAENAVSPAARANKRSSATLTKGMQPVVRGGARRGQPAAAREEG